MARTGIYKSEVKKARDALLAQGRRPSVDAVRVELGNTGSKTTIHRYLQELAEEEGGGFGKQVAVSDALQDLVSRLASRLHEEAEARIKEIEARHATQLDAGNRAAKQQAEEIAALRGELQRAVTALQDETTRHADTAKTLVGAEKSLERLSQQVSDMTERLKDNEAHRTSLEEKHQHARDALEHYRQSVKDQREQEQRRHEGQVQQLQVEIRTLNQTVIVKQNELTQAYQDLAKNTAELAAAKKEIRRANLEAERIGKSCDQLQQRIGELEASVAKLTGRLEESEAKRTSAEEALNEYSMRLHAQELELVELRTRADGQNELLALLKVAHPTGAVIAEKAAEGGD